MPSKLLISIIVPIYGVENYINQCADSILSQTYDNIEFIFVNDGTKDNSVNILKALIEEKYIGLKRNIKIIEKQNEGLPQARKTGLENATGDYIIHVDSDDWIEPNAVEVLAQTAQKTGADFIYFDVYKEYGKRRREVIEKEFGFHNKAEFAKKILNNNAHGYLCSKMVKRSVYVDNNVFFPKYGMREDIVVSLQLIYYSQSIVHEPSTLYHYRRNNQNSISRKAVKQRKYESVMNLLDLYEHYEYLKSKSPVYNVKEEILYRACNYALFFDKKLLNQKQYLTFKIKKAKFIFNSNINIINQLILKIFAIFQSF